GAATSRGRELPVQGNVARCGDADRYRTYAEYWLVKGRPLGGIGAAAGAVAQRARSITYRTWVGRHPTEHTAAGLTVAYLVLQRGIEHAQVGGNAVGGDTSDRWSGVSRDANGLVGECNIALLRRETISIIGRVSARIENNVQRERAAHLSAAI